MTTALKPNRQAIQKKKRVDDLLGSQFDSAISTSKRIPHSSPASYLAIIAAEKAERTSRITFGHVLSTANDIADCFVKV